MKFEMSESEAKTCEEFKRKHLATCSLPPVSHRYSYTFKPTGIGVAVHVQCNCGEARDITDYGLW